MKAKFNEEKNTLKVNGKKFNVISAKSELKAGDFKNGEWVNNKRYVTFEIEETEEIEEVKQPQRKFKKGDKVRIKDGVSSLSHRGQHPCFVSGMDYLIGKTMTIELYCNRDIVLCNESGYRFNEDWLEPYVEELKKGDLAIFWYIYPEHARIAAFSKKEGGLYLDSALTGWRYAVKFECTKEQKEFFNKVRKGEITL